MTRRPTAASVAALRPGGLALAVDVARRFHLEGASKVQIAQELGVNRFKVARLLDLARVAGLVQVVVGAPPEIDATLSAALRTRYGLQHALVLAEGTDDPTWQRVRVGRLAAELLEQLVTEDDVVGLAWGRAMSAVAESWTERVPATFVQLAGALARTDVPQNGPELVQGFATRAGGRAVTFYAPLLVADEATAAALARDESVAAATRAMDRLTKAVVSVGAWAPGQSTVHDALDETDRRELWRHGACAEVTGLVVAEDGRVVETLRPRSVGVSEDQLRRTGLVFALAVGDERATALRAVLRSGLLGGVVTHASLARSVLAGRV